MARCLLCGRDAGFMSEVCDVCQEKRAPGSTPDPQRHVSGLSLLHAAAREIYDKRAILTLAVSLPILISMSLRIGTILYRESIELTLDNYGYYFWISYSLALLRLPFYVMFATICHRVVLLGAHALPNRWGLFWSMRETRFLGWLIVLSFVFAAVWIPFWAAIEWLPYEWVDWIWVSGFPLATYLCWGFATYLDGRLSLVLPATAVGRKMNPVKSWRFTRGFGITIFFALLVPIVITEVLDYLLFDLLIQSDSLVITFIRGIVYYPLIALGVVIITIAYRDLVIRDEALEDA